MENLGRRLGTDQGVGDDRRDVLGLLALQQRVAPDAVPEVTATRTRAGGVTEVRETLGLRDAA